MPTLNAYHVIQEHTSLSQIIRVQICRPLLFSFLYNLGIYMKNNKFPLRMLNLTTFMQLVSGNYVILCPSYMSCYEMANDRNAETKVLDHRCHVPVMFGNSF